MLRNLIFGQTQEMNPILLVVFLLWTLAWKGFALWKSARNNQRYWFAVLLIINTVGILEILYLAFFQPKSKRETKKENILPEAK